jgi:hypothetical protein
MRVKQPVCWWRAVPRLCLAAALFLAVAASGADADQAKRSAATEAAAKAQRKAILSEIQKLPDHDWAGEYYAGDGLGVNTTLALAPGAGFVFEWHGCLGLYDRNYGTVTATNGVIRLACAFENQQKGFQGIAPALVPIAWGSRHYLVPATEVIDFCNSVNDGGEPRTDMHGTFFLRTGDEKKAVAGLPQVPAAFRGYLLVKPVEATIIRVGSSTTRPSVADWKFKDTPVTLDAGTNAGLRVGMELVVTEPSNMVESVRISKVTADRAEGVMTQIGEEEPGPQMGWRLSTQAPWRNGARNKSPLAPTSK